MSIDQQTSSHIVQTSGSVGATAERVVETRSTTAMSEAAPLRRVLLLCGLAFAGSTALTVACATQRSETFAGHLSAQSVALHAPSDGTVEWLDVAAGNIVRPGQELAVVRDVGLENRLQASEEEIERLEVELAAAESRSQLDLHRRSSEIDSAEFDTQLQLTGLLRDQFRRRFEQNALGEQTDLIDSLAGTEVPQMDIRSLMLPSRTDSQRIRTILERAELENELETIDARIQLCEQRLKELGASRTDLHSQVIAAHQIPLLKLRLAQAQTHRDEQRTVTDEHVVASDAYGMLGELQVRNSGMVNRDELIAEVFDRDHEFVTVELPSFLASTLTAGEHVCLHFPGDEEREGVVAAMPLQARPKAVDGGVERLIPLHIRPAGRVWPRIPIGTTVHVSLID